MQLIMKVFKTVSGKEFLTLNQAAAEVKKGPIREFEVIPAGYRLVGGAMAQAAGYTGDGMVSVYYPRELVYKRTHTFI
jgi:hypothetical protein